MMSKADRAKQFMPFSPLSGLDESLAARERVTEERIFLGEDAQMELNRKLLGVEPGEYITVEYYRAGRYVCASGTVTKIDMNTRRLILGDVRIPLDDLKDMQRR